MNDYAFTTCWQELEATAPKEDQRSQNRGSPDVGLSHYQSNVIGWKLGGGAGCDRVITLPPNFYHSKLLKASSTLGEMHAWDASSCVVWWVVGMVIHIRWSITQFPTSSGHTPVPYSSSLLPHPPPPSWAPRTEHLIFTRKSNN